MKFFRPTLSSGALSIIAALYVLFGTNYTFWQKSYGYFADHPTKFAVFTLILVVFHIIIFMVFSAQYILKPVFIFLIMVAAVSSYFGDYFGTIITREMIENTVTTTAAEAGHLITMPFIRHVILFGVLPSLLLCWVRVKHRPILKKIGVNSLAIFVLLLVGVGLLASDFGSFSSMFRQERTEIMGRMNPVAPITSAVKFVIRAQQEKDIVAQPLGLDAVQGSRLIPGQKKRLTVIVVGETARKMNFSLNGYERETNPQLKARDVIAFQNTTSCGTETAVSVPCMFSPFGRKDYSSAKFKSSENLVDVLSHAGIQTKWWDNNTGDKKVAARISMVELFRSKTDPLCSGGECLDQVLVNALKENLDDVTDNAVIVLHMLGSHGPAYYLRYPENFEEFKPACRTAIFSDCTREEIVSAFDNTILYTDHILASVIDILKDRSDEFISSMVYMSDHGESLGEKGLYLHAMPYIIAPSEQTEIPFITWFSDDFTAQTKLDLSCVRQKTDDPFSHDNLFPMVLGLMDIQTSVYHKDEDPFASCRGE